MSLAIAPTNERTPANMPCPNCQRLAERLAMLEGENKRLARENFELRRKHGEPLDPDKRQLTVVPQPAPSTTEEREAQLVEENRQLQRYRLARQRIDRIESDKLSSNGKLAAGAMIDIVSDWKDEGREGPQPFNRSDLSKLIGVPIPAAGAAMNEIEDIGVVTIERSDNGIRGPGHRDYWKIEPTEKLLGQNPEHWIATPRRNPNGKGCRCNAPTVEIVHTERRTTQKTVARHDTACSKCGAAHKTRTITLGRSKTLKTERLSDPVQFKTASEAKAHIRTLKDGGKTPKKTGVSGPETPEKASPERRVSGPETRTSCKSGTDLPIGIPGDRIRNSERKVDTEESCPDCGGALDPLPSGALVCDPCQRLYPGAYDG